MVVRVGSPWTNPVALHQVVLDLGVDTKDGRDCVMGCQRGRQFDEVTE